MKEIKGLFSTKVLVTQALLAALYVALTFGLYNISYGPIQFRVAEFMLILVLIHKRNATGIIIGTFIANMIGAYGVLDMVVGTGATILVCILMIINQPKIVAFIWPTVINAVVIGLMLAYLDETPFWINALQVGTGEFLVTTLPFIIFGRKLLKNKDLVRLFS